ncbi:coiled-coil domain-containing protein mad1 [Rhodotorula mucilaginosa]|uniref:Spindle assembly checkpoint component MAD1 n=1 Tax=Rhodotorula mucilaginosa TaxID=5537 RepID=A0A9P7B8H0_RHOMI|nr:coiled-coil domain-containing protein mad1 [Rhodotorula mucilaginosa]
MTSRGGGPSADLSTPLVSNRTLRTAAATVGSSRLPLRRETTAAEPQTVGRPSMLRRPSASDPARAPGAPPSLLRLSTRRPSLSNGSVPETPAGQGRSTLATPSLKRTPSLAGLQQETETSSLKRQLARALAQVEEYKHVSERTKLEAAIAADKAQAQLDESASRIDLLERHRAVLLAKEREASERADRKKQDEDGEKAKFEKQARDLRQQLDQLQDEHADLQASFSDLEHSASQAIAQANSHQQRTAGLQQEIEHVRSEAEEQRQQATQERQRRINVEAELEQEKLKARSAGDSAIIREELHRKSKKDNAKLQRRVETYEQQHANAELLKETNRSLEKKLKQAESLKQQVAAQAVKLEILKREKADWSAFIKAEDNDAFSSPRKITKNLATTRIENATLRDRLNSHELEVQRRDRIVGQLEQRLAEVDAKLKQAEKELAATKEKARVDSSQTTLLRQEVQMLKRHLESYTTEEAINHAGNFDTQKTTRIAELEELLEAHRREVATLTDQVSHWRGLVERYGGNTTEIVDLEEREKRERADDAAQTSVKNTLEEQLRLNEELRRELDEARNELELMEQENEGLANQVELLEENQGIRGAYNPETHQVLEFRDSPDRVEHAIRTATLERLRSENDALLRRLGDLEKGLLANDGQSLVPRESLEAAQAESAKLREQVQQKEKMMKRITQAVAEKAETLRLAVQKLLGFQLSFLESGRIRVTSVYAPSKDRSLAFDPWPGGPMPFKLVSATDEQVMSLDEVRRSVGFWLDGRGSLPGFMASLTMSLYEESTRGQNNGVVYG